MSWNHAIEGVVKTQIQTGISRVWTRPSFKQGERDIFPLTRFMCFPVPIGPFVVLVLVGRSVFPVRVPAGRTNGFIGPLASATTAFFDREITPLFDHGPLP